MTGRLHPADVEAIAARVVELLAGQARVVELLAGQAGGVAAGPGLVDAATVAETLKVSPAYVRANADLLGAVRLGSGPRPRLRFDLETARAALARSEGERSQAADSPPRRASRRSAPSRSGKRVALLPAERTEAA